MSSPQTFEVVITNEPSEGQVVQSRVVELLEQYGFSGRDVFSVRLAMEEALVNAIKHGNQMDPDKTVRLECHVDEDRVRIIIEDQGPGFDPGSLPDPTAEENLEMPGGRGVMLIQSFMDNVQYNDRGNMITMERSRSEED